MWKLITGWEPPTTNQLCDTTGETIVQPFYEIWGNLVPVQKHSPAKCIQGPRWIRPQFLENPVPNMFNNIDIWAICRPSHYWDAFVFNPVSRGCSSVYRGVVLLENIWCIWITKYVLHWCCQVALKDFNVCSSINSSMELYQLAYTMVTNAPPKHDATPAVRAPGYNVLTIMSGSSWPPNTHVSITYVQVELGFVTEDNLGPVFSDAPWLHNPGPT